MAVEKIQVLILGDDRKRQLKLIQSFTGRVIPDADPSIPFHRDTKVNLENPREAHDIFKSCWILRDTPPRLNPKIDPFFMFDNPTVLCLIDGSTDWDGEKLGKQLGLMKEKSFSHPLYFFIDKTDSPCEKLNNDSAYFTLPITLLVKQIFGDEFPDPIVIYGSTGNPNDVDEIFATIRSQRATHTSKKKKSDAFHDDDSSTEMDTDEEENNNPRSKINKKSEWEEQLDNAKHWITQNRICFAGNLVILAIALVFLILAASPVGAFLALGTLSAMSSVALLGFGAWVLWNAGCRLVEELGLLRKPDGPNSDEDNPVKFNVIIETDQPKDPHIFAPNLTDKHLYEVNTQKNNTNYNNTKPNQ